MASEMTGAVSRFRVKSEAVKGTKPTTGFIEVPVTKMGAAAAVGNAIESKILGNKAAVDGVYLSPAKNEFHVGSELGYTNIDVFLQAILGGVTTSGDGATTAYANIHYPATAPPTLHVEEIMGDIPTTKVQRWQNIIIPEFSIDFDADGLGTWDALLVAEKIASSLTTGDAPTTTGLVTLAHVPNQIAKEATVWNLGFGASTPDTLYCVKRGKFNLKRPYENTQACLGSTSYKAPVFTGPLSFDFDVDFLFADIAALAAFVNQTALTGFRLKWAGAIVVGSDTYALEIRTSNAVLTEWAAPIESNGLISQNVKGKGFGNTGSGLAYQAVAIKCTSNISGATL